MKKFCSKLLYLNRSVTAGESSGNKDAEQAAVPDKAGHNTSMTGFKDKKQLEIELLMRQQEQLKNLEALGKMQQQQQKAKTDKPKAETPKVVSENLDVMRSEERVPEESPAIGKIV